MTPVEWLAFFVLLVSALAAGITFTLSNARVAREIRLLRKAYRQAKSLQMEQAQAQAIRQRQEELQALLADPNAWRDVIRQILADVFPEAALSQYGDGWLTATDVSAAPASFVVARQDDSGEAFVFTVSPQSARRRRGLFGADPVIPLDAALAPTARVDVQAVWQQLAGRRQLDPQALPRQAAWYLVVSRLGGRA